MIMMMMMMMMMIIIIIIISTIRITPNKVCVVEIIITLLSSKVG